MPIYLMRHGETEENLNPIFMGDLDVFLNSHGVKQAYRARRRLRYHNIKRIISSPVLRAKDTATIIGNGLEIEVEIWDEFTETDVGKYKGMAVEEVKDEKARAIFSTRPWEACFPEGESVEDVYNGVAKGLDQIDEREGDVLVVSHGTPIQCAICFLLGLGLANVGCVSVNPGEFVIIRKGVLYAACA